MKRIANLNIVVAMSLEHNIIGINNDLPWAFGTQKADMKRFREITTGHVVIMGSKTFESMGSKPLPKRANIVITTKSIKQDGVAFINPLRGIEDFLREICKFNPDKQLFIIGGANLIDQTKHLVSKIFLSEIDINPVIKEKYDVVYLYQDLLTKGFYLSEFNEYPSDEIGNNHRFNFLEYKAY